MRVIQCCILFIVMALSGCVSASVQDEKLAARQAGEFCDVAFIRHDAVQAYALLLEQTKQSIPADKFAGILVQMHPSGYPNIVKAIEYEPLPGQRAMNIILVGENSSEKFYYRLVMAGDAVSGYRVAGLFRSNGPYPGNPNLRGAKLLAPL
ncbi:MAG: hypothetical protein GX410_05960 [Elusimicrobia bacterium]|nr:hypothetical protein [Elusimicrobiota bacterium]